MFNFPHNNKYKIGDILFYQKLPYYITGLEYNVMDGKWAYGIISKDAVEETKKHSQYWVRESELVTPMESLDIEKKELEEKSVCLYQKYAEFIEGHHA